MRLRIRPRFCLIVIALMIAVFSVSLSFARRDLDAAARQLAELQREYDYTKTDDYVIRVARDELGLIMPGEVRYISES